MYVMTAHNFRFRSALVIISIIISFWKKNFSFISITVLKYFQFSLYSMLKTLVTRRMGGLRVGNGYRGA